MKQCKMETIRANMIEFAAAASSSAKPKFTHSESHPKRICNSRKVLQP